MSENQSAAEDAREYVTMCETDVPVADTNGPESPEMSEIQVKFEVEDPEYDQSLGASSVTAGLLRSFHTPQSVTTSQSAAEWTGSSSAIRTELRKIMEDKSLDSSTATQNVQNVIENLLKKNENLLAQNNAQGYKPHSRRGRPALDGSRAKDLVFPGSGQSVTFAAGQQSQGRVAGSGNRQSPQADHGAVSAQMGQLMRPKSPTRRCAIPERDRSHFSLALMESRVGCEESEKIFHVQEHEMVCAVSSQTKFLNKDGRLVSSVDISYYWCNFCNYSTTNKNFLMQHIVEHRFHCKHCRYQSFSRADVIHHSVHTHPNFQDTAAITQYCTLLSDYLRIHNPSEILADHRGKRKDPPEDDGDKREEPVVKVGKTGAKREMVQKSYSADFDMFDVTVEDVKEKGEEETGSGVSQEVGSRQSSASSSSTVLSSACPDSVSQTLNLVSSLVSQPMSSVTQSLPAVSGGQPVITQVFSASTLPQSLAAGVVTSGNSQPAGVATPHTSPSPTPPPQYPNSVGAGAMQQMRSNLYWSCGYCKFTSTSQSGIKEHSVLQHSGKPHRYVALIKAEGGRSTPPLAGTASMEQTAESDVTMETDKGEAEAESADTSELEEPPVLVKQEPTEVEETSAPIRVRFPTPRNQPKEIPVLKCYHCNYTSRNLGPLRNHIVSRHRGKCLVGVGGVSSRVFMCCRSDCTFRSSSGQTFLIHAQECTPWLPSDSKDVSVASHLKKCLEATVRAAEETPAVSSSSSAVAGSPAASSSQVSYDLFSCIYCNCQFTWSKKQTKQHVLEYHNGKCLVIRDVRAHRNRKRSCVFFCRWCPWEGKTKEEHDVHSLVCRPAQGDSQPDEFLSSDGEVGLLGTSALDTCEDAGESTDKGISLTMDSDDLGPPDITHDEDTLDRLHSMFSESSDHTTVRPGLWSSSAAEDNPQCKTFLSDGVLQLYINDPNGVDSDDPDEQAQADCGTPVKDLYTRAKRFSHAQRKGGEKVQTGTKKQIVFQLRNSYDIHKKVKHFPNKAAQSSFSTPKHKPHKRKMTDVQCFLCGFGTDSLRSLKLHMQYVHHQHVSFSFRSMYHSSLHLKCRFFVCPLLDCTMYRYNEADVLSHYRQCHSGIPHPYLDPSYSPAPVKFQRRVNKCRVNKSGKLKQPMSESSQAGTGGRPLRTESEGQYLCLYCDEYYYSTSVSKMKAHYLAVHPSLPIIVRDVIAFRHRKRSRLSVCENVQCSFRTYLSGRMEEHVSTVHRDQWDTGGAGQVLQCTLCGWMTAEERAVCQHLTTQHVEEAGATMVTLSL